jgi:hypothetical protein
MVVTTPITIQVPVAALRARQPEPVQMERLLRAILLELLGARRTVLVLEGPQVRQRPLRLQEAQEPRTKMVAVVVVVAEPMQAALLELREEPEALLAEAQGPPVEARAFTEPLLALAAADKLSSTIEDNFY